MIRHAPTLAPQAENLVHAVLTMLSTEAPEPKSRSFEASIAVTDIPTVPPAELSSDVAIRDCDDLFRAVEARLRLTVGEWLDATPDPQLRDTARRVQVSVLECVAALDQLHTTLMHELDRRRQLELEVFDAQTALAQARAELGGTQPGAAEPAGLQAV